MAIDDNTTYGLTGAQIKELPSKIQGAVAGVAITGAGAPTTATVGTVGKLYEDTTNGKLYICTAVTPGTDPDPDTYTWEEVGSGGGGIEFKELVSLSKDYPTANPDGYALWNIAPGFYVGDSTGASGSIKIYVGASSSAYFILYNPKRGFWVIPTSSGGRQIFLGNQQDNSGGGCTTYWAQAGGNYGTSNTRGSKLIGQESLYGTPNYSVQIRGTVNTRGVSSIAIGSGATSNQEKEIVIGADAKNTSTGSISGSNIIIGTNAIMSGNAANGTAIGTSAQVSGGAYAAVSIGPQSKAQGHYSVAIGAGAKTTSQGEMNIGTSNMSNTAGYNNSNYRLLTGLYDPQSAHDAATKGYVDTQVASAIGQSYSTTEVDTGATWIDGSHIYKKSISVGSMPNNTSDSAAHGISNLANVIKAEMIWYDTTDSKYCVSPRIDNSTTFINFAYANQTNVFYKGMGTNWSDRTRDGYITLWYTKSQ